MAKIPAKKKWPKGLKARLARAERIEARKKENAAIAKAIKAAQEKIAKAKS